MFFRLRCLSMPLFFLFLLNSCADSLNLKQNSEGSSFVVGSHEDSNRSSAPTSYIGIKKTALGKEHLFQGSMIVQAIVGRFNNLKSRIVTFEKVDSSVYMFEATHGHTITHDIPQNFVLAKFPIVHEADDLIYFDFSAGMEKIFISSDWNAQDFDGDTYKETYWDSIGLDVSFIKSARVDDSDSLIIRQIAQAKSIAPSKVNKTPVEIKYYLTPYKKNENFKPTESKHFKKMGFFELAPQLKIGGEKVVYASKFDMNKPIVFAVSANTPKEYRDAVKEGVLYWNKAFGSEILKVIDAPEGVSAPDFKYNVIQWVDWKDAGFAYADAQMDPRTGEILHAQIFMTSVFAFSSKKRAKALLEQIMANQHKHHHHHHDHNDPESHKKSFDALNQKKSSFHGIDGFNKQPLCDFQPSQSMVAGLTKLVNSKEEFSDETYLKISQDYVRETVAHEVGHTLGLRHNFAGSLYANFDVSELRGHFLDYARNGIAPAHIRTSSSVMEYQNFEEGVMTGDQLITKDEPLDYDKKVIQSLYFGKNFERSELPPFCTDSHTDKYLDCKRFDSGHSVFKNAVKNEKSMKESLPFFLLNSFVKAKEKVLKGELLSIGEGTLDPLLYSTITLSSRKEVLNSFKKDSLFLEVERKFPYLNSTLNEELSEANLNHITEGLSSAGGMKYLFKSLQNSEVEHMKQKFINLVDGYNEKEGLEGQFFEPKEIYLLKMQGEEFFSQYEKNHFISEVTLLNEAKDLRVGSIANNFLNIIEEKATRTILKEDDKTTEVSFKEKVLKLPVFSYPHKVRVKGTELLKTKAEDDLIWGLKAKATLKEKLTKKVEETLGEKLADIKIEELPNDLARWVKENKDIIGKLS